MDDQARILQQRIEVLALCRNPRQKALKGV